MARSTSRSAAGGIAYESVQPRSVQIPAGKAMLAGDLMIPAGARGIAVFAHGSGSSRHSARNRYVAGELQAGGLATLLMDLLTPAEEEADAITAHVRFDIRLLAERLIAASDWIAAQAETRSLMMGYFGASTGAAAALVAAAARANAVGAVVSRGGRPDLAGDALGYVRAPTLLIVGGHDLQVIDLNEDAMNRLQCEKQLRIVPGATHLFEKPGALEKVADLARDWFENHLGVA